MPALKKTCLGVIAAMALPLSAAAQFAGSEGGDIELYADDAVSVDGVTTLTGQVDARQGDVRILADRMEIYSADNGSTGAAVGSVAGDIERIVASGNFYYITPEQEVRGDQGIYQAAEDTFIVTGDVILVQEDSVVRGKRLVYELSTRRARVLTDCEGRKCARENRVAILIKNSGNANSPAS